MFDPVHRISASSRNNISALAATRRRRTVKANNDNLLFSENPEPAPRARICQRQF